MWSLAVLTGWPRKQVFLRENMGISPGQKSGRNNQVTVWEGSTVIRIFQCVLWSFTHDVQFVVPVFFLKVIIAIITSLPKTYFTNLFRMKNKGNNTRLPNRSQISGC